MNLLIFIANFYDPQVNNYKQHPLVNIDSEINIIYFINSTYSNNGGNRDGNKISMVNIPNVVGGYKLLLHELIHVLNIGHTFGNGNSPCAYDGSINDDKYIDMAWSKCEYKPSK